MKIALKIGLVAGVPLVGLCVVVLVGVLSLQQLDGKKRTLLEDHFQPILNQKVPELLFSLNHTMSDLQALERALEQAVIAERTVLLVNNGTQNHYVDKHLGHIAEIEIRLDRLKGAAERYGATAESKALTVAIEGDFDNPDAETAWIDASLAVVDTADAGDVDAARALSMTTTYAAFKKVAAAIDAYSDRIHRSIDGSVEEIQDASAIAESTGLDMQKRTRQTQSVFFLVGVLAAALSLVLAALIIRALLRSIGSCSRQARRLAAGELTGQLEISGNDELAGLSADMLQAMNGIRDALGDDAVGWCTVGDERRAAEAMTDELKQILSTVEVNAERLKGASGTMIQLSSSIAGAAEETSTQASEVRGAAKDAGAHVQAVAASSEQMTAAIKEIARSTNGALDFANEAIDLVSEADHVMADLDNAAKSVGELIELITSIADQTNLLALNATIESARAGEAGKGFAVVASEVKDLAKQTADATVNVNQTVSTICTSSAQAVQSIGRISEIIKQIHEYQGSIAAAVEEQSATVSEASRAATGAADRTSQIVVSIEHVDTAA
jgi:methyl-accepting chemotaxis protein